MRRRASITVGLSFALLASTLLAARPSFADGGDRGRRVYRSYCATCHGESGLGDGPTARLFDIRPRNLVTGVYRFRSTPSGSLPTNDDLSRSITYGLAGTEMPGWGGVLSPDDIRAVVTYVVSFAPRFAVEPRGVPVVMPRAQFDGAVERTRGGEVYEKLQCAKCHGESGEGNGPARDTLRDEEGRLLTATDFTVRRYKGGVATGDVERAILTGLDGAAMPSYEGAVELDEVAMLARYVLSLRRGSNLWTWLTEVPR